MGHRWETAAPVRYSDTRPATPTRSVGHKRTTSSGTFHLSNNRTLSHWLFPHVFMSKYSASPSEVRGQRAALFRYREKEAPCVQTVPSSQHPWTGCWIYCPDSPGIWPAGGLLVTWETQRASWEVSQQAGWSVTCWIIHTNREDEEADIVQPIRCLTGQLLHEAAQDSAEIALISAHSHLNCGRSLRVTVTARKQIQTINQSLNHQYNWR